MTRALRRPAPAITARGISIRARSDYVTGSFETAKARGDGRVRLWPGMDMEQATGSPVRFIVLGYDLNRVQVCRCDICSDPCEDLRSMRVETRKSLMNRRDALAHSSDATAAGTRHRRRRASPVDFEIRRNGDEHRRETCVDPADTQANQTRTSLDQEIDYKAGTPRIVDVLVGSKDFTAFSGATR